MKGTKTYFKNFCKSNNWREGDYFETFKDYGFNGDCAHMDKDGEIIAYWDKITKEFRIFEGRVN